MGTELLSEGLELFAAGDLRGAIRLWLLERHAHGGGAQLDAYLRHVQNLDTAVYAAVQAEVEAELAARRNAEAQGAAVFTQPAAPATSPAVAEPPVAAVALAEPLPPQRSEGSRSVPPPSPEPDAVVTAASANQLPVPPPAVPRFAAADPAFGAVSDSGGGAATDPWEAAAAGLADEVQTQAPGLELVAAQVSPQPVTPPASQPDARPQLEARLESLVDLDDFTGALEVADELLAIDPNHAAAQAARSRCRAMLQKMYTSRLGDLQHVPAVRVAADELIWLDLDHRSGFVLAQVDGASSFEEIVEITGMDPLESYRILSMLVKKGVIA